MGDDEIVREFLVESYENLDRLDRDLVALEEHPGDRETLASIFRTIHTIKGTSGFLGFTQLEAVAHVGESLLARLRDGLLHLRPELTTALLAMVDAVRQMLGSIEQTGSEGQRNDRDLIETLTRLLPSSQEKAAVPAPAVPEKGGSPAVVSAAASPPAVAPPAPANPVRSDPGAQELSLNAAPAPPAPAPEVPSDREAKAPESSASAAPAAGQSASDSTIRVDVNHLDRLMNRVGELVLLRNQIVQFSNASEDAELAGTSQRLNLLTTELQEGVMKTRMQPIGNIWSKFPRTVRDVALSCGKQVRIEMEGKETELDKTIIEAIKDPLTHLVRNAVDHGIEAPEIRKAAGKDPEGRLFLRAFHEGGQVNIEITDDGAGLDLGKIRAKAVEKGLVTADQVARMSERESANLIFLPGLSTAKKVTNVSGRGVGMDVVRTNIEKIGGTVDLQSKTGKGSTVRMKIPLTLAIIPALTVTAAGSRYAIPQVNLLELVRLEGEQARKGIENVAGAPVYRLRGRLLPLVYLRRELKGGQRPQRQFRETRHLDFSLVRDKHRQWVATLQQVLEGELAMTPEESGSHETCALGKWIYSEGVSEFGEFSETQALEETHRQFHQGVRRVLTLQQQGEAVQAKQELAAVDRGSEKIMQLLTAVEKRVADRDNVNIVVLRADERQFGLVVDEINDSEEIVVKPLGKQLKSINAFAGSTIMGDGRVALILDVNGIAQRANILNPARDSGAKPEASTDAAASAADVAADERQALLLFRPGAEGRMAIPLSTVARLEEFKRSTIERSGAQEVVQYRGRIMPLVRVADIVGCASSPDEARPSLQVIVYSERDRSIGLVVEHILDIVEERLVVERPGQRHGVLGSALIQQQVTDLLDVAGIVRSVDPEFTGEAAVAAHV